MMHSYTELSPSGTGVHILFRAERFRYDANRYYIMNRQAGIEVYVAGATNKYVTITGQPCTAYGFGDRSDELQQVLERFMVRSQTVEGRATPDERQPMLALAERSQRSPLGRVMADTGNAINAVNTPLLPDQLLEKAFSSRRGDAIRRLWSGDTTGYPSHSETDQALCSHLAFWTGRDAGMMDAMFRQSGLMRDKWDRKQASSTYGQITIQTAIRNCAKVYTPRGQRQAQPEPAPLAEAEEPKFLPVKPLTPQSSELPPFPVDCLPEPLRSYVSAVAEHSQTSPDMAAVIGLGALAVCLQNKYRVEGSPGYYEPLSLYTVVIAPPGERKSSVMNDMPRALRDYADEYNRSRSADIKANRRKRESLQRQINAQQKKLEQSGKWEDEAQLNVLNDQLEALPELKPTRFFADDCSSEALTSLMAENGGVISVISTEGGVFDMMNGRYSNKVNIDVWLKGHCGDTIYVDRKCREVESIAHPALSAILSIQPCVLEEIMTNATMSGRGLIARFLYASPPSRIGSRTFTSRPIPPEIEADYRSMIYRLMALDLPEEPRTLTLAPYATEQIAEYFQHHERFLVGEGQAISDWASKYIGAVLRIAGLIHAAEMQSEGSPIITEATIAWAICIGQYFLQHSLYAYSMMGTDLSMITCALLVTMTSNEDSAAALRST